MNEPDNKYFWIAVNGSSCAISGVIPMKRPQVVPTPEQMWGFPTHEEAKHAQHICLTEPISKVQEFLQSLEPDIRSGRVVYIRPEKPEPPTRGQTLWLEGEHAAAARDVVAAAVKQIKS